MLNVDKTGLAWIDDLTGGLNDTDPPQDLAPNQCQIAQNIEWVTTRFAQRRQGGVNTIHATEPWGSNATLNAVMRHTPTADEMAAEMFGVDNGSPAVMGRLAGSNQFVAVTVSDTWNTVVGQFINGASLNGKFFVAGDTAVNRLHVWDGATFRRVGLATPAAPTVANTGAGAYPAVLRFYKIQWQNTNASPVVYSELSPSVSFTPSGTGTAARITRPAPPNESETGWVVWGSPDGVNFYVLAGVAIGTSTYDDSAAPSSYSSAQPLLAGFPSSPDYFSPPISPKYVLADEDRLILLSSWEAASQASAVMWTPVIGTTPAPYNVADDERVPSGNRLDLDRQDGGGITGGAILNGTVYVFKQSHIYRLVRTGDVTLPYRGVPVTKSLGALSHKSLVVGEDETGSTCLYFLSRRGPYRITADGALEYLGRDIETLWNTVNLVSVVPPHGVWHQTKRQIQWWVVTGIGGAVFTHKLVFHVRHGRQQEAGDVRGGWAIHTDGAADVQCSVMFANTLSATMSLDLKPYAGQRWLPGLPDGPCFKYDADGTTTDRGPNATAYVARVKTAAFAPGGKGVKGGIQSPYVLGTPSNRTLAIDFIRDFGLETRSGTAAMPAQSGAGETRRLVKVENDAALADAMYAELVVDDEGLGNAAWSVDAVGFRPRVEGQI